MPVTKEKPAQEVPEWKTMGFLGALRKNLTASYPGLILFSRHLSFWLLPGGKVPARHKASLWRGVFLWAATAVAAQFGF